jgi:integrase
MAFIMVQKQANMKPKKQSLKLSVHFRPARSNKATGTGSIYFIVLAHKRRRWFATGITCSPSDWDAEAECFKKNSLGAHTSGGMLMGYQSRALQYINTRIAESKPFNNDEFTRYVLNPAGANNNCFFALIREYCNTENLSWGRVKHYNTLCSQLRVFQSTILLQEVDYLFVRRFQQHLAAMGNNKNTIVAKVHQLKAVVHFSQRIGLLTMDPLKEIRLTAIKGNKQHLIPAELQVLEELHKSKKLPVHLQQTLTVFLFGCYTGLRFSDIEALRADAITNNIISLTQIKTKKIVSIPIIPEAAALLPVAAVGKCFKTISNQKNNVNLQAITRLAGIQKKITFHCSRHTFATLSLYWGIPAAVVAELLGVDLRTAMIYAKISDDLKAKELTKWGGRSATA